MCIRDRFDDIRDLFTQTPDAKEHGYEKGRFSFNVKGGRCEACQGDGILRISMHFLPDVYVPCEECGGKRYNEETLQVKFKDKNIYDVLEMTVEEAIHFFSGVPKIKHKLQTPVSYTHLDVYKRQTLDTQMIKAVDVVHGK